METAQPKYISNPFELIRPSFEAFKLCWANLLIVALVIIALAFVVGGGLLAALSSAGMAALGLIFIAAPFLLAAFVLLGSLAGWIITKSTIEAVRGRKITFKAAMPPSASVYFKYVWTNILVGLAVLGGFILLIVPGIIFLAWFGLAPYLNVDEGTSGMAALKRSRELGRGRTWEVLGAYFLNSCLGVVAIVPVLGPIASPIISFVLIPVFALRYNSLLELKQQPDWENVRVHPLNYLAVIIGLIYGVFSYNHNVQSNANQNQTQLEKNAKPY